MYKLTFSNGYVLDQMIQNGTNYISKVDIIDEARVKEGLSFVVIENKEDGSTEEIRNAAIARLCNDKILGGWCIALTEKPREMILNETINSIKTDLKSGNTSLADVEEAVATLYEMVLGG